MLYLNLETYLERNCNIFPLASDHEFDAGGGVTKKVQLVVIATKNQSRCLNFLTYGKAAHAFRTPGHTHTTRRRPFSFCGLWKMKAAT